MDDTETRTYDVIVIGAGPAGENVADRAVQGGLTAVLVEQELVGGECSYWACIPSKTLLRDGEVVAEARALPGAAAAITGTIDAKAVLARRDQFTAEWDDAGQVRWAEGAGIEVIRGQGRIYGARAVRVARAEGDIDLVARQAVVLATGTTANIPPIPGLREARPWTSREATSASSVPPRLVVLGGGVVGCEMSQAWSSLGSRVTLVARSEGLLPALEPFAGEILAQSLRDAGVDVRLSTEAQHVSREGDGPTILTLDDGTTLETDALLVAVGRQPSTLSVGLEVVGLQPGRYVPVDETMRARDVEGGWLYAVGDANGRRLLTHMGKYQARCCGDVIVARARGEQVDDTGDWTRYTATADDRATPAVVFTDPPVGSVGLTEKTARASGIDVRPVEYDLGNVSGAALLGGGYVGKAKFVVDEARGVLVGATFVGRGTPELVHSATVAIVGEVPLHRLWHAVPSFPTVSEVWLRLLEAYGL